MGIPLLTFPSILHNLLNHFCVLLIKDTFCIYNYNVSHVPPDTSSHLIYQVISYFVALKLKRNIQLKDFNAKTLAL
jgi:hypothetical protein